MLFIGYGSILISNNRFGPVHEMSDRAELYHLVSEIYLRVTFNNFINTSQREIDLEKKCNIIV